MVQQAQQTPRPNCKRLDDIQNNAAAGGWVFSIYITCRDSMMLQFQRNLQKSNVDNAVQNSSFVSLFSSKLALYEYIYFCKLPYFCLHAVLKLREGLITLGMSSLL